MKTFTIFASWGECWTFRANDANLTDFGFSIEETMYIAWEMEPITPMPYWYLAHLLLCGVPVGFSFHGVDFATLQLKGNEFSLIK